MALTLSILLSLLALATTTNIFPLKDTTGATTQLQERYSTCRGLVVENILKTECAAFCYDSKSYLWVIKGYVNKLQYITNVLPEYCYCFLFNSSYGENTGRCSVCFEEPSFPFITNLNSAVATFIYAKELIYCKYFYHS